MLPDVSGVVEEWRLPPAVCWGCHRVNRIEDNVRRVGPG